ncbi:phosphonate metabolism protein/1,5-bisphosphokinase (PRPP-forming) PhnN [Ignatzschineria sp. LJL83]
MLNTQSFAYYIMGPSGAGKDSVIEEVSEHLGDEISRPLRYITRKIVSNDAEHHNVLTTQTFEEFLEKSCFSLCWEANGFYYGYDKQWLADLGKGKIVLLNGSRSYWDEAKAKYGDKLCPVYFNISIEKQTKRLQGRGRESEKEIEARISRSQDLSHLSGNEEIVQLDAEQPLQNVVNDFISIVLSHRKKDYKM